MTLLVPEWDDLCLEANGITIGRVPAVPARACVPGRIISTPPPPPLPLCLPPSAFCWAIGRPGITRRRASHPHAGLQLAASTEDASRLAGPELRDNMLAMFLEP